MAVSWQGDRWGRLRPILVSAAAALSVPIILLSLHTIPAYWFSLTLFSIVWSYLPCYLFGYLSTGDRSGRYVIASQLVTSMTAMLATAVIGVLLKTFGLDAAARVSMVGIGASTLLAVAGAVVFYSKRFSR